MKKRQLKFIVALCVLAVLIWILGEVTIGFCLERGMTLSRIWAVLVVVGTCTFSVWKCPRE
ncbi:MAG: hypothetical protein ACLUT1_05500 [Ruminococcus sp.]|nr:hypothetical protein [Ruminococcus sp.]CDE33928.1 putative uncharacterized protein [Ruminococcus sp. CAG:403]